MSLARIIAMGARRAVTLVGISQGSESSLSGMPHAGAAAGDYVVIIYYSARTIMPPSGTADYTTISFANTKLSHRRLADDDIGESFTFSSNTPYLAVVVRGATGLSAERKSFNGSGSDIGGGIYRFEVGGIAPSFNAGMILGVACGDQPTTIFTKKDNIFVSGTFDANAGVQTSGLSYTIGLVTKLSDYASGTTFKGYTTPNANGVNARIYEFLS